MNSTSPVDENPAHGIHDVIIMGGGLAGMTLALQLRRRFEGIDVLVLERRTHPVPEACHKIGESTVEIGAHYFQEVLGLKQHLMERQLKKFGFRFFFSDGRRDIENVTELGASRPLPVPAWQIDRGIFENFLGLEVQRQGARFVQNAYIRQVDLAREQGAPHTVTWQHGDATPQVARSRWVIDACGRAGLLKRKLGLARENAHPVHAVWFRVGERIRLDDWSQNAAWQARCETPTRWLSTNHLVGAGYWVWLIPLSSGSHSVGIVADPRFHALGEMNTFDGAMRWLERHQPRLFDDLQAKLLNNSELLQDFAFFRRFSYDCAQVFSADRWALAGEAGRFLDPFYSPGSDFIAIGNTYITELIGHDRAGLPLGAHAKVYEQIYRSFYDSTMTLYVDQYAIFGDPEVLPMKVMWDYTYYWGVLAPLFFGRRLTDLATLSNLGTELARCQQLNGAMQAFLRAWCGVSAKRNPAVLLDQAALPWFSELNRSLEDELDEAAFRAKMRASTRRLGQLADEMLQRGLSEHPALDGRALRAAVGAPSAPAAAEPPMLFTATVA